MLSIVIIIDHYFNHYHYHKWSPFKSSFIIIVIIINLIIILIIFLTFYNKLRFFISSFHSTFILYVFHITFPHIPETLFSVCSFWSFLFFSEFLLFPFSPLFSNFFFFFRNFGCAWRYDVTYALVKYSKLRSDENYKKIYWRFMYWKKNFPTAFT